LLEEANGYQAEVVQRAVGDASRFRQILVEYAKAPAVTRERLYLDMMQSVVGNASKVLIDQKGGNSLLYLPLDKLIQQSANASAAASSAAAAPATPPVPPEPPVSLDGGAARSRETLRSRDRGDAR
jgi:membrane protease subunit HflK